VRLISDQGFRVEAAFARFVRSADGKREEMQRLGTTRPLVEGQGRGIMVISNISMADIRALGLRAGDSVILQDHDWPNLAGHMLGYIQRIDPHPKSLSWGTITVRPAVNLKTLREVMVYTGQKPPPVATGK
jgi:rod shape-determining protein MreC